MTIRYAITVNIAATNRDRVSIRCVVHGVSKVFVERRYAIAIAMVATLGVYGICIRWTEKSGDAAPIVKIIHQSSPLDEHQHLDEYEI